MSSDVLDSKILNLFYFILFIVIKIFIQYNHESRWKFKWSTCAIKKISLPFCTTLVDKKKYLYYPTLCGLKSCDFYYREIIRIPYRHIGLVTLLNPHHTFYCQAINSLTFMRYDWLKIFFFLWEFKTFFVVLFF